MLVEFSNFPGMLNVRESILVGEKKKKKKKKERKFWNWLSDQLVKSLHSWTECM